MKYFQFIRNVVLLVLLGTLAGCQNDELIVDMGQGQDKIVLSFSDAGHSMTRVSSQENYTTPTDVEKAVTHIDVFVLKNDMIDYYERISTGGADVNPAKRKATPIKNEKRFSEQKRKAMKIIKAILEIVSPLLLH